MTKTLRRLQRRGGDKSNPTTQAAKEKAAVIRKQFEEMGGGSEGQPAGSARLVANAGQVVRFPSFSIKQTSP